jgi:uncharacterized protein YciI
MKINTYIFAFGICGIFFSGCKTPISEKTEVKKQETTAIYDSVLARELGADDYGMKQYVMAFLKAGPNRNQDSAAAAELQKAHLQNITNLASQGKLLLAGPFMGENPVKGIYIFNVTTLDEARKLTETDPAIKAGRLVMELHPWYGSAALMKINEIHKKLEKKNMAE